MIGALAVLYVMPGCTSRPVDLKSLAKGEMAKLSVAAAPTPAPATPFVDAQGRTHTLAEFRGKVVVVNFWASWCAPCRAELPSLGRLAAAYQGQDVVVVALNVDRDSEMNLVNADIARAAPLSLYRDIGYKVAFSMTPSAGGMPTTVILDRQGNERARLEGGADWSGPEAKAVIEAVRAIR